MIREVFEALTGHPYYTVRSATAEFGPPPAVEFAADLAGLSDTELLEHGDEIVARARAGRRAMPVAAGGGR